MYTDLNIKNFRVFDKDGALVPLRPITILTGCNNAGKSSIVKALCLLKDFCRQIEDDYENGRKLHLENYKIDFHKTPNNVLGGFDIVRHREKKSNTKEKKEPNDYQENKYITFEVVVESSWLLQDVILQLKFGTLDWDDLNNGYLQSYAIKTLDEKLIYEAKRGEMASMNFSIVKKSLLHFLYGQYAFSKWQEDINLSNVYDYEIDEENDVKPKLFKKSIKNIINDLGNIAPIYLLEWQVSHCHHEWKDGQDGACGPLIKKIPEDSFEINSPKYGVFCYFPCLDIFKDFKKKEIRQEVYKKLESLETPISSLDRKIVDLFFDSFEKSESESLHEYISKGEDSTYFNASDVLGYGSEFAFPETRTSERFRIGSLHYSNLPKLADWNVILKAMDLINKATTETSHSLIDDIDEYSLDGKIRYKFEMLLDDFLTKLIEEIFVNLVPGSITYTPTTIVQPKRLYSLEENDDFARTLKRFFEAKKSFEDEDNKEKNSIRVYLEIQNKTYKDDSYKPCSFINKWLKELDIANHVEIKSHADGYGVTIHLYENKKDKKGMQLVDKGIGGLQLFAVLLKIETAILETKTNEIRYKHDTTGLNEEIIKLLRTHNQLYPTTVALEEPECHLHPSLQSKLADMIVDANLQYGIHFLIESHSEYLIRKLQLLVSQEEIENNNISMLYINPTNRPSCLPIIIDIGIDTDGTLKNEFGTGFFDESWRLSKELYRPKKRRQ